MMTWHTWESHSAWEGVLGRPAKETGSYVKHARNFLHFEVTKEIHVQSFMTVWYLLKDGILVMIKSIHASIQANLKNCGPLPGNKFDLEVGQRSMSRSLHGINRKGLSQGSCMPNINSLSLMLQKIWARLKFLWQTDWRTDWQTDGRMSFNVPRFRERRGTIILLGIKFYFFVIHDIMKTEAQSENFVMWKTPLENSCVDLGLS